MIPDIRKYTPVTPPLPEWLKWLYFGTVATIVLSGALLGYTWKNSAERMKSVERKSVEIAKANEEIRANEAKVANLEASRQIRESRSKWHAQAVPTVALQASAQLAVIDAEAAMIKFSEEAAKKEVKGRRKNNRPPVTRDIPDVLLKSIEIDVRNDTHSPEMRISVTHNTDSRLLFTEIHKALTKSKPDGYELLNYKPEERQNGILISTTWAKTNP